MKTPSWEPYAGALLAWLQGNTLARPRDLWTITLVNGTVLQWSGAGVRVALPIGIWELGPAIARSRISQTVGVSVDTLTITLGANSSVQVGGRPLLAALAAGVFDNARVALQRAFFDSADACKGVVPVFAGRIGAVRPSRAGATLEARSLAELLDVPVPSDVFQAGCRNTLFDAQCGLTASAWTVAGAVASADATRRILTSSSAAIIAKPTAWADMGVCTFTSGANSGISRMVRTHTLSGSVATLTAVAPWPYAIAAADAFTLRAGCNKVKAGDCAAKFSNTARFRGEPFIPAAETIA